MLMIVSRIDVARLLYRSLMSKQSDETAHSALDKNARIFGMATEQAAAVASEHKHGTMDFWHY